jgi:hypothetical protein
VSAPPSTTVACPGCGSVLAAGGDDVPAHPGASASCARLFEVTLRGLREEAPADPATAVVVQLADDAYDAQHPAADDPRRLAAALERLAARFRVRPGLPPGTWRTTVADIAADLDVIDLPVLVESWAHSVADDWSRSHQ